MALLLPSLARPAGAVIGGLLMWSAFPARSWWWAAPIGIAVLVLVVRGRSLWGAMGLGFVFGMSMLMPLLSWTGLQVGPVPWVALCVLESLFVAIAAGVLCACWRLPSPLARVPAAAGAWLVGEALASRVPFGGFGWTRLAFSQSESPILGTVALGGVAFGSFVVALAGTSLACAVVAMRDRRRGAALIASGLVLAAVACGLLVPTPTAAENGTVRVAGVQGNVPRLGLEFNAERRAVLDNHARVTTELAEQVEAGSIEPPDLVVWPENASDIDPFTNADARTVIADSIDRIAAPTLVGTLVRGEDGRIRNTTLLWMPGRGPVDDYVKQFPVPFAEYVPYRSFFRSITSMVDLAGDMVAGTESGILDVQLGSGSLRLGTMICFEVVIDSVIRDEIDQGAELLVVQTNNATFGRSDESVQQLAASRVRAVETGRSVAHVSTVGVSALIAPDATIIERIDPFTSTSFQAELPRRSSLTIASRVGAWPELVLVVGTIIGAAVGLRRRDEPTTRSVRADAGDRSDLQRA